MSTAKRDNIQSFVLYQNYEHQFEMLSMPRRGELIMAIFEYARTGVVPTGLSKLVAMAFSAIKDTLDRDRAHYLEICEINRQNGSRGGRPKKSFFTPKTERFFEKAKKPYNDNNNDSNNENDNGNKNDNGNENETDNDSENENNFFNSLSLSRSEAPRISCAKAHEITDAPSAHLYPKKTKTKTEKPKAKPKTLKKFKKTDKPDKTDEAAADAYNDFFQAALERSERVTCATSSFLGETF